MPLLILCFTSLFSVLLWAQEIEPQATKKQPAQAEHKPNQTSPVRGIVRPPNKPPKGHGGNVRNIDGSFNNQQDTQMGSSLIQLERLAPASYADGASELAGVDRPSAREISNSIFAQVDSKPSANLSTDFLWQWGQFLDHDIDLTDGAEPHEQMLIPIPEGDSYFDPGNTGTQTLTVNRSIYDVQTGNSPANPRQQINEITAWIDASNVYGSDQLRADALRTLDGSGQLKTSAGNLLPFNTSGLPNAGGDSASLFLAGDVRANEQVGLTAMHTLFVREHNFQADKVRQKHPSFNDDEIYQRARKRVIALMQVITYKEFLPMILGPNALPAYTGYKADINANIFNEFSTAAYRFGHTLLSPQILRLDAQGQEISAGHLPLRQAFFRPDRLISEGGIEPILRGLASQVCQSMDSSMIDDVRNFLFGAPGAGGFDLAALNIQRGRDHGLASFNDMRRVLGLNAYTSFEQINTDPAVQQALADTYTDVEQIDLWVGGLAEQNHQQAMVGETFYHILKRQFVALRDGDRYWYQNTLSEKTLKRLEDTRLSDVIKRNTSIGHELQTNVFKL